MMTLQLVRGTSDQGLKLERTSDSVGTGEKWENGGP